jgi:hypothetical protein
MENFSEAEICAHLRSNPDVMYVTPDGHKLYVYVPVKDGVFCLTTEDDLTKLNSEELNVYLQDCLEELMK